MNGHPWLPNSPEKIKKEMLEKIGVKDVEDLYRDIPEEARLKVDWDSLNIGLGRQLSELEVKDLVDRLLRDVGEK